MNVLIGIIGAIVLLLIGFFSSKKSAQEDAKVIDLTIKIGANKEKANAAQKDADEKIKEYNEALKQLDPDFHNDDGDPKKSS